MKSEYVNLQVANMRKPQKFIIYPNGTSKDYILLQSDKRMAILVKATGDFFITTKNYNYPTSYHLQIDKVKIELSSELKEEIKRKYSAMSNGLNGMIQLI